MSHPMIQAAERRGTSGKDRVTHRPGAHDDLANATAGVLVLAAESARHKTQIWMLDLGPEPRSKPVGPEQQQLVDRMPAHLFERPSHEFTCGRCANFNAKTNPCALRGFSTMAHLVSCGLYEPRPLGPLVRTGS